MYYSGSRSSYEIVDMELETQEHHATNVQATSPTQMEFVTSVPTIDVSGEWINSGIILLSED